MFYSHVYLRKNGRFGLVWLAATQSRVLSRRELMAVNVSLTVSNILEHVPGNLKAENRPRRFSLYLSSQLMYGSVKVLQKQWEYLLGDLNGILRSFHSEISSTTEIDLILTKPEPVTLESYVPSSIKDKYYDPFFGVFKESIADVPALLASWDDDYVKKEPVSLGPEPFKAELGSPHSVTDVQKIQILDHPDMSLSIQIPDEQDLPYIDPSNLAFIQSADQQINISVEDLITPAVSRILENQNASNVFGTDLIEERMINAPRPVEETPAAKITRELPSTPKKQKRKQTDKGDGARKRPRNLDAEERGSSDDATARSDQHKKIDAEDLSAQPLPEEAQRQPKEVSLESPSIQPSQSPNVENLRENWQHEPSIQLSPIAQNADPPTPSPMRKRQPHKLIIDEMLQMSRLDLKKNMNTSHDTCIQLVLPTAQKKDLFKEPGSKALSSLAVRKMWIRNCKLGLRVSEPDKEQLALSDISPLESPRVKRKEPTSGYETPGNVPRDDSALSGIASMEKGRNISDVSGTSQIKEKSTSLIGHASDDSSANISADQQHISMPPELDRNLLETSLAPLPEEQELIVSPVPLEVAVELQKTNGSDEPQAVFSTTIDDSQNSLLRVVHEKTGGKGNWTTFRTICPVKTTSRQLAIALFQELCWQVAKGALQVRQDDPYGEIIIWERD